MIGRLVGAFTVIILLVSLFPIISSETLKATEINNTWGGYILRAVPILFALGIILSAIGIAVGGLRGIDEAVAAMDAGNDAVATDPLTLGEEDTKIEWEKNNKTKQTYEEYVKERLNVERMIKER
jgi:hypothetical protein